MRRRDLMDDGGFHGPPCTVYAYCADGTEKQLGEFANVPLAKAYAKRTCFYYRIVSEENGTVLVDFPRVTA